MSFSTAVQNYLDEIYSGWKNPATRNNLFGELPIDDTIESTFTVECPPIPWLGNLKSKLIVISLEPLRSSNFNLQVQIASQSSKNWEEFYLTEFYFEKLYRETGLSDYWDRLACFTKGYLNLTEEDKFEILKKNLIEFPFVQYHAKSHPYYKPSNVLIEDFFKRLEFKFEINDHSRVNRILYFNGRSAWNKIKKYFKKTRVIEKNILDSDNFKVHFYEATLSDKKVYAISAPQFNYRWSKQRLNCAEIQDIGKSVKSYVDSYFLKKN